MRILKRIVFPIACLCLVLLIPCFFNACKIEDPENYILAQESLTVEVGDKVELVYSVNPKNSLVTFKQIGEKNFDYVKENDKDYITGLSVGKSQLVLNTVYKKQSSSTTIDIIVVEKGSLDENNGENKPNVGGDGFEAGDRIKIELLSGVIDENRIVFSHASNGFLLNYDFNFNVGDLNVYIAYYGTVINLQNKGYYTIPKLAVDECVLTIEVLEASTNIKYIKTYNVLFRD